MYICADRESFQEGRAFYKFASVARDSLSFVCAEQIRDQQAISPPEEKCAHQDKSSFSENMNLVLNSAAP